MAKVGESGSICWKCQNAVPTSDGKFGCNWSRYLEPVEGWVATDTTIKSTDNRGYSTKSGTYKVIWCPEFIADKKRKRDEID